MMQRVEPSCHQLHKRKHTFYLKNLFESLQSEIRNNTHNNHVRIFIDVSIREVIDKK
jgi:hypothetical protein